MRGLKNAMENPPGTLSTNNTTLVPLLRCDSRPRIPDQAWNLNFPKDKDIKSPSSI